MPSITPAKKPRDAFVEPVRFTATEKGTLNRLLGRELTDTDVTRLEFLCATERHRAAQDRPTEANVIAELAPILKATATLTTLTKPSILTPEAKASVYFDRLLDGTVHHLLEALEWEVRRAVERLASVNSKGAHNAAKTNMARAARAELAAFYRAHCVTPEPESEVKFLVFGMRSISPKEAVREAAKANWITGLDKTGKKRPAPKTPK